MTQQKYPWDYVIVGGGSAGCVLAARLSEDPARRVLLIEAGGRDLSPAIHVPGLVFEAIMGRTLNWHYKGLPDPTLNNRALTWAGGRVLGGSSSINGMVFGRGLPADYAAWVEAGNPGWGWNDLMPYFRRMETWTGQAHPTRGTSGPLRTRPHLEPNAACTAWAEGAAAAGVPFLDDYNVGITEGMGYTQATQRGGVRHSTARAFLGPASRRPNLTVMTHTRALRLVVEAGRCTGVVAQRGGKLTTLRAEREVIVSSGAIASPKLLLLSGIGDAAQLRPHGIDVVHELPGVGANMNEHVNVKLSAHVDVPTYDSQRYGLAKEAAENHDPTRDDPLGPGVAEHRLRDEGDADHQADLLHDQDSRVDLDVGIEIEQIEAEQFDDHHQAQPHPAVVEHQEDLGIYF